MTGVSVSQGSGQPGNNSAVSPFSWYRVPYGAGGGALILVDGLTNFYQ